MNAEPGTAPQHDADAPGLGTSTLYEALRAVAERRGAATAVRTPTGERLDYDQLLLLVDRSALGLHSRGVRPGSCVALSLRNSTGYIALILAVARLGARYVPLLSDFDPDALRTALVHTRPALLVTDGSRPTPHGGPPTVTLTELTGSPDPADAPAGPVRPAEGAAARAASVADGAPCHTGIFRTLWTSGSTEFPKLTAWRQDKFRAERLRWNADTGIDEHDVFLCRHPLDVAHATDLHVFAALLSGAELVLADPGTPADALLRLLREHRVTVMSALPQHYADLVDAADRALRSGGDRADVRLPLLRRPLCGGAYLDPTTVRRADDVLGVRIRQIYGSTEFGLALGNMDDVVQTGAGLRPVRGVGVRLAPLPGLEHPDHGELVLRSDRSSEGYLHPLEANARAFRDGEFWTGDFAVRAPDGTYRVLGRTVETLTGTEGPVTAPLLDEEMRATGAVGQAVVLPVRPGGHGREVYVAVRAARSPEEAARAVDQVLGRHGLKGVVRFAETIPLTPVGKVDKPLLRRAFTADGPFDGGGAPR
ncbi:class I adenylate-forming enzyme family protein [Streptomyces sp. NPDC050504]|uniref:class I adenylate-forming enzyme family protein n=1 Tax=Streptomyces sp. NPDC050504 TaxID=3365618 RepID=UPI0037B22F6F